MSKIRTNLSPQELKKVSKGMNKLARSREIDALAKTMTLEKSLLHQIDELMETYSNSLQSEITRILTEED